MLQAVDLGERLSRAFVGPRGMPKTQINLATGISSLSSWLGGAVLLAEVGTVQLEFFALARHTGCVLPHDNAHTTCWS